MPFLDLLDKYWFSCEGASIHFVYSFNLRKDADSYVVDPNDIKKATMGTPENRKGITPHLTFKPDSAYIKCRPIKGAVVYQPRNVSSRKTTEEISLKVTVNRLVRIFRTGCTCSITIEIPRDVKRSYDKEDILGILNLVTARERSDTNSRSALQLGTKYASIQSIYDLFHKTVTWLCKHTKLQWLGKELDLIDYRAEVQSPWVVSVLEVDGEVAHAFCDAGGLGDDPARTKVINTRKFQHDVVPILFRSVSTEGLFLEPAYLDPPSSSGIPGLFSVNVDARLFVAASRRSVLCICRDQEQDPAYYFLPGLLDICEIVRTRWHMLIMLNRVLDNMMSKMFIEMRSGSINTEASLYDIMKLREWLALGLQDPGMYIVAGDALSKIYDNIIDTLRIDQLTEMMLQKATQLEKLHSEVMDYRWMETTPRTRS